MTRERSGIVRAAWLLAALAVVAMVTWVVTSYRMDIAAARGRIATGSELAQTSCGPIEYATRGDGPPVLVVHGAGGGFDQGLDVAGDLSSLGFRVIAVSRFGYLRTPLPDDASAEAQADAHACLLDALGIPRAAILGMSAGGPSTLQFALRHPDRAAAMILLVPATYVPREGGEAAVRTPHWTQFLFDTALRSDFVFWKLLRFAPDLAARAILATPPGVVAAASPEERARFEMLRRHILPVAPRRPGLVNDAAVVSRLRRFDLEKIAVPTLLFSAEDDGYGTWDGAKYTAAQMPNARFVGFPAGGHMLVGHTGTIEAEITSFLRSNGWSGMHTHHEIDYIEFLVRDTEASKRFYAAAFGWTFTDYGPDYVGIHGRGSEQGGLRRADSVPKGGPLVVLYSTDLEATQAAVRTAGGKIVQEIFSFPGGRRFHFEDPSGNELAVWSER
ncbi:MAG TPA: alpha/beta fold hydrolase [Steroidobacteraceae bacterium]|nr:alpha/beta fold hydrolase [Steroidobacteraceae bacterium]